MSHTVHLDAIVEPNHTVTVALPDDIPVGPVRITVTVESATGQKKLTPREFLHSEFFGMFADRDDLPKTNEEFSEWRRKLWDRSNL